MDVKPFLRRAAFVIYMMLAILFSCALYSIKNNINVDTNFARNAFAWLLILITVVFSIAALMKVYKFKKRKYVLIFFVGIIPCLFSIQNFKAPEQKTDFVSAVSISLEHKNII